MRTAPPNRSLSPGESPRCRPTRSRFRSVGISSGVTVARKMKCLPSGETRPAMSGVLGFVEHRCRRCCATLDVYFQQRAVKTWRKHNPVVGTPASAARIWDIGDGYSRAPGGGDLHQLAAGKEAYIAAIRRPERVRSTCGTVQRLRRFTAERAHPQQLGSPECATKAILSPAEKARACRRRRRSYPLQICRRRISAWIDIGSSEDFAQRILRIRRGRRKRAEGRPARPSRIC